MPTMFWVGDVRRIVNHLPDDSFGLRRGSVGSAQGCVIRQPDIQIKPILDILRKELSLELGAKQPASDQENQGGTEDRPTVFYGFADESVIEAIKSALSHLFNGWFSLCRSTQDVVAEERNKGHRDKVGAQQTNRHHHRETLQELAGIAGEHQE